ncbi:MAG: SAM-dependent methyltransferase [Treponema sp.]
MPAVKKKNRYDGAAAFHQYYADMFGSRWESLKAALQRETTPAAFFAGGAEPYYLDAASIAAAAALPPLEAGTCLDMCAAPGGKTLVLASRMGAAVDIIANELSAARRSRLVTVLDSCLSSANRCRITVTGKDAATLPRFQAECFDRILLDAPCSSERHVLTAPKYLQQWTPSRIKTLAQRQWALLSAAFLLLKPNGFLVYATCALSYEENDANILKLLKKYGSAVNVHQPDCTGEAARYGCLFLPDRCNGAGPLYFSLIEKNDMEHLKPVQQQSYCTDIPTHKE